KPSIIHCHDHHSGLIPFFVDYCKEFSTLKGIPTVFTVHNGEYQGWMPWHKALLMPEFNSDAWGLLDWNNMINPLAAAIKCCWAYTTVSEGYLEELYTQPQLGPLFLAEKDKAFGIVNGIDSAVWNPEQDPSIDFNYSLITVTRGKKENKDALCKEYNLDKNLPLIAFIGRFAGEKGADLLPGVIQQIIENAKGKVSLFVLGSGDPLVEEGLEKLNRDLQQQFALVIGYNEALAH